MFLRAFVVDILKLPTEEVKRKRTFRKFTYRGIELNDLMDMNSQEVSHQFFGFYTQFLVLNKND
ncbi:hypothetical protein HMI55_002030 [Coelomomyces lativittatus]|nr:hypothetical protein HMI55_002030 [Coelomomyces lativittatus]